MEQGRLLAGQQGWGVQGTPHEWRACCKWLEGLVEACLSQLELELPLLEQSQLRGGFHRATAVHVHVCLCTCVSMCMCVSLHVREHVCLCVHVYEHVNM